MPARRFADRARLDSRSHRRPTQHPRDRRNDPRFENELERDFAAMKRVWQMIRAGAVRMVGEIGRQY
ncbi:MAG: hypothetical protein CMP89_09740 [Gammaproteobacteria bacterium]|nr:hypothetical protein [Gammaproteobacteria bacterium]